MRILPALILCLLFTKPAIADDYTEAAAAVKSITDGLLEQLENRELYEQDKTKFYQMLESQVLDSVDMTLMSKLILREYWTTSDPEQQMRFTRGFKNMIMESYGKSLLLLSDIEIKFVDPPKEQEPKKYQIIHTQLFTSANEPPLSIDYYLIKRDVWKIFDLVIDGLSLVKQFRQSFGEEIAETGFEALLVRLEATFMTDVSVEN